MQFKQVYAGQQKILFLKMEMIITAEAVVNTYR